MSASLTPKPRSSCTAFSIASTESRTEDTLISAATMLMDSGGAGAGAGFFETLRAAGLRTGFRAAFATAFFATTFFATGFFDFAFALGLDFVFAATLEVARFTVFFAADFADFFAADLPVFFFPAGFAIPKLLLV